MMEDNNIYFSIDAGIIDRLGRELVSREETAVSELIKNCYDADATRVTLNFIDAQFPGGTLTIDDDGIGMTREQLINGFMRLSSTDKVHSPYSERHKRLRAGRKGIGRFATQRLGNKLVIITQTKNADSALKLTINWEDYFIDQDLQKVKNSLEIIPKSKEEGTTLIISRLRESWSEAQIKKAYRHVTDLLQPEYLSENAEDNHIASKENGNFLIGIYSTINNKTEKVKDELTLIFENSLAIIEGYVDDKGDGFCGVKSEGLDIDDYALPVENDLSKDRRFHSAKNVHFKFYYFIYKKPEYYKSITKNELNAVMRLSKTASGIKLYRNGFRVLPYGEPGDDWLNLDSRYVSVSGVTNIPLSNQNFFGFVELTDTSSFFEETASREGLIRNIAYEELVKLIQTSVDIIKLRIGEKIFLIRRSQNETVENDKSIDEKIDDLEGKINNLNENPVFQTAPSITSEIESIRESIAQIRKDAEILLEEQGMLRILAGMGLLIGEFSHEIVQYSPSIRGFLSSINQQIINGKNPGQDIKDLGKLFNTFITYVNYFRSSIRKNMTRELLPVNIIDAINEFVKIVKPDFYRLRGAIDLEYTHFDLFSLPMHPSEWNSILYNLYTNSKKAIRRAEIDGKIFIEAGRIENNIYLKFSDNGDGIPEENKSRIFNAFFTTSTPPGFDSDDERQASGNGLGLKIIKDIVESYNGNIQLNASPQGYTTTFLITIPSATPQELNHYGL